MADFSDLEGAICDVNDMANVAQILIDKADKEIAAAAELGVSAKSAFRATAYWRDAATFAVLHLKRMTGSLRKDFYEAIESKRS